MYEQKLAHTRGLAASIASGLAKMNEAKLDVNRMKVRPATPAALSCVIASAFGSHLCMVDQMQYMQHKASCSCSVRYAC